MLKRYADRLLKLAAFLDTLPEQKFNFGVIIHEGSKTPREALRASTESCGTVGCAMGWMPAVFPRSIAWAKDDDGKADNIMFRGKASFVFGFEAAEKFFALSEDDVSYLFDPMTSRLGEFATAQEVAKHIRGYVKKHTK